MNTIVKFAILVIAAGLVVGTTSMVTSVTASVEEDPASKGLEIADDKVHEGTDSTPDNLSEQDIKFHQGLCQGGHSTEALEEVTDGEGCDALDPPGNSGGNRQDED